MDEAILTTTIEQHTGTRPNGLREVRLHKIVTDWSNVSCDGGDWTRLADKDREWYWQYVREVHEAVVALESLDCEARAAAKDWLAEQDVDLETEARLTLAAVEYGKAHADEYVGPRLADIP